MTPGARVAAAIEVLDQMQGGKPAEAALTNWARRSRFAGSKDRAAIRDHVFDLLRCRSAAAYFGRGESGRALMIGLLRFQGADLAALFHGDGHAPKPLTEEERAFPAPPTAPATRFNLPEWLLPQFETSLGEKFESTALALQDRAPVHLRVNLAQATRAEVCAKIALEGVETKENPLSPSALTVTAGARRVRQSTCFTDGLVELQDAASQAVVDTLSAGGSVLDYCAGGGGKALALAMDQNRTVFAHDIDPGRMTDLAPRAARAGVQIAQLETNQLDNSAPYDAILCDAPCSGSGAWRRAPEGKWLLTPERLQALTETQQAILEDAARLLRPDGTLVYATCSVLRAENEDQIAAFLKNHPDWACTLERRFDVSQDGDGFFVGHLMRK